MIRQAPNILRISVLAFLAFIALLILNSFIGKALDSFILLFFYGAPWSYLLSAWLTPTFDLKTDSLFPAPFLISVVSSLINLALLFSLYLVIKPLATNTKWKRDEEIMVKFFIGILYVVLSAAWAFALFAFVGIAHAIFRI
jgi:hypothetical protein